MLLLWLFISVCLYCAAQAREVTELHGANFELTLTSYKYIAILFYDDTNAGRNMKNSWMMAAHEVVLSEDCDMAQVCLIFIYPTFLHMLTVGLLTIRISSTTDADIW